MNAGGTFQDLLNLDTTQEDIQSVINDLKTLEQEVNDNTDAIAINQNNIFDNTGAIFTNEGKITQNTSFININSNSISSIINIQNQHSIDIQFNSSAIATNTNNISTNTNNITSNISNITTNTNNIASNISNIATNTNNISTLNNSVLLKDGSIPLDVSYNPINNQDVATKDYVDTHNTSNAYLRVDGSNSMTGNLSLSGHLLRLDSLNSMYVAGGNIAAYAHSGIIFYISNNNIMAISSTQIEMLKNLNLLNNNIFNVNDIFLNNINNVNFNNLVADVNSNNSNIASNLGLINTNISNISSNLGLITNNTTAINNNDTDITNLNNNKLNKSGDTMTGSLNMNSNFISNCLYITSYGDITVLNNRYVKSNLFEPVSGNIIYLPGSNGMGMAFIQSNFGTNALNVQSNLNLLTNDISNVGLINGYDLQTLNDGINNNITDIASNLVLINNNTTAINNNDTDITNLDNNKLSKSGGVMTGSLNMNSNFISNCLYITSYGDITVLNNRYVKSNLFEPVSGNIIYLPGSNGMGMAFIQSNFGTNALNVQSNLNLLTNDISNVGLINGYDLQTLNDGINNNITDIASNLVLINNNTTAINNNDTDITNLDNNKLSKSGGVMTGDIDMNYNDLKYCNDILATSLTSNGVLQPLTIKTTQLVVDAEDLGDCELLLKADASNIDDGNNPRIAFQQDGTYKEAAIFLGDNELNISSSAGGAGINFRCGTTDNGWLTAPVRMSITTAGAVRTGVTNTTNTSSGGLSIFGCNNDTGSYTSGSGNDTAYNQLYIRRAGNSTSSGSGAYGWIIGNQTATPATYDNDLYFNVQRNGVITQPAYIADGVGLTKMNFTGQHRCMPDFKFTDDMVGLIVEATGRYMNLITEGEECSQITCISINDAIPVVQLCNGVRSKKVFGVISSEEDPNRRKFENGNFVSLYKKEEGDNRLYINSIGEGAIWIVNSNGNIENGDYICSSGIYGMRQDLPTLNNYTVAKATMDCDFNPQMEEVKIWENGGWRYTGEFKPQYKCVTLDSGLKIAFVGATYHCG